MKFTYEPLSNRVVFGVGRRNDLPTEVAKLGATRALLLSTPFQAELVQAMGDLLGDRCATIHTGAEQHVPYHTIEAAMEVVTAHDIDILIALGGGSTIGLAKGIALENGLPIIAVPTTYSGSEMTHIWGISRDGYKTTGRDPVVKPKTVIYDPELIVTLPADLSLTSGINAMAHAVEALYAEDANPISSMMAEESIRMLARSLPLVKQNPADIDARTESLYGAWLAANVLDTVGIALHHKLSHTVGGSFNMPHSETHTVILPYATAYNSSHTPDAMAAVARALDCPVEDVPGAIQDISRHNGGPVSLKEIGFAYDDLDKAADHALRNPYYNPRPVERDAIRALLERAYHGERP